MGQGCSSSRPGGFRRAQQEENHESGVQPPALAVDGVLRILSINVWCHHFSTLAWLIAGMKRPKGTMPPWPFTKRIDLIADAALAEEADLVTVQECFLLRIGPFVLDYAWMQLSRRLADGGLVHQSDPYRSLPRFFGQNSGLCVFSNRPLVDAREEQFSHSGEPFNSKGMVYAEVELSAAVRLSVCTVHLDSRNKRTQALQVAQVGNRAASLMGKDDQFLLLTGDFNISPTPWDTITGPPPTWSLLVAEMRARAEEKGHVVSNAWGATDDPSAYPKNRKGRMVDHAWLFQPRSTPGRGKALVLDGPSRGLWIGTDKSSGESSLDERRDGPLRPAPADGRGDRERLADSSVGTPSTANAQAASDHEALTLVLRLR
mmetsp:Transcript_20775/g.61444  ORF Transcript_20775/g.61444 Transcript_20775/m.61444 type:complete len:374 (-) Transcript_20775:142-1263(-)